MFFSKLSVDSSSDSETDEMDGLNQQLNSIASINDSTEQNLNDFNIPFAEIFAPIAINQVEPPNEIPPIVENPAFGQNVSTHEIAPTTLNHVEPPNDIPPIVENTAFVQNVPTHEIAPTVLNQVEPPNDIPPIVENSAFGQNFSTHFKVFFLFDCFLSVCFFFNRLF